VREKGRGRLRGPLACRDRFAHHFHVFDPSKRPNPHGCWTTCYFSIRPRTRHGRMQNRSLVPIPRAYGRMDGWTDRNVGIGARSDLARAVAFSRLLEIDLAVALALR